MSQCPYGVQAINGIYAMTQSLGDAVDVNVEYIGSFGEGGKLCSMHGTNEVRGDIAQKCIHKVAPARLLEVMHCQNKDYKDAATNWEACLGQLGIPVAPVRECIDSGEGAKLLAASFERSKANGDTGSPTLRIAGKKYSGQRKANDFARAACAEMHPPHPYCTAMPVSPPVNVVILSDQRCPGCKTERYEGMLRARIGAPVIRTLDYGDPEGRKLYDATSPGLLPVLVFDSTLEQDPEAHESFNRGLKKAGSWYVAPLGGEFHPKCAAAADCARDECRDVLSCRKEVPNRLDVYIMSKCQFGAKAIASMEEVLRDFPATDFRIHYIGAGDEKAGLTSMHGPDEVAEDRRAVCAIAHSAPQRGYLKYLWCRNKDLKDDAWTGCTGKATGVDAATLRRCSEGPEGSRLLDASFKSGSAVGIGASPTWIVNNKFKHTGLDAWTIKKFLCEHNPKNKSCASLPATRPPGSPAFQSAPGCL